MRPTSRRASPLFWTVPQEWPGQTVYIVAGGPSVADQDTDQLRGLRVLVVNSSWERCPFAQYLFFGDRKWWVWNRNEVKRFAGRIVTTSAVAADGPRVERLKKGPAQRGISPDRQMVCWENTSLHAAINLAAHLIGSGRIVLLGADMKKAADGRTHHHKPHYTRGLWKQHMQQLRHTVQPLKDMNIDVINTSPVSLIDWWPKMSLDDAVALEHRAAA